MARFNAKEYLLNTKTGVLHLNGHCHHVKNLNGIMQFDKDMLDSGIITPDEFDNIKKQLL